MNILIFGAGRMGVRHAIGALQVNEITNITIVDINIEALLNARKVLIDQKRFKIISFKTFEELDMFYNYETIIISTTANDRIVLCKKAVELGCKNLLIEKPLAQSLNEVQEIINFFNKNNTRVFVNLNMRINPGFIELKNDVNNLPQFIGNKMITINTGALGIGANGIHYIDFLIYLLDADNYKIIESKIDEKEINTGRGTQFKDYGGWCLIEFYSKRNKVGTSFVSINPNSSVFGGMDIISSHGRINLNESSSSRIDYLRSENSDLPESRYHADYLEPIEKSFPSIPLSELTKIWIEGLFKNKFLLPQIKDSLIAHKIIFEWLSTNQVNNYFPIT